MAPPTLGGTRVASGGLLLPDASIKLLPFQRRFIRGAMHPGIRRAALSLPRGNGKSTLAGLIAAEALREAEPHQEIALVAASLEQGRIVHKAARQFLGENSGYRFLDSTTKVGITAPGGAKLRVLGANGRTAMGLVNTPLVIADEPGSWTIRDGQLMQDAIETAQGKPNSALRVIYIGTLAPQGLPGHWWYQLVASRSHDSTYVQFLQGDRQTWDRWPTIQKANPLMSKFADSRKVLLDEREAARRDTRLKARFLSYRLNIPSGDESTMLLTVEDWKTVLARPQAVPAGRPVVGIDLGAGRAWSAAAAVWRSGRLEALAIAPGIPDLAAQEKRDRVPAGTYQQLKTEGRLMTAKGLRVPKADHLIDAVRARWGVPAGIVCDRFRLPELKDTRPGCPVVARVSRWSESSADIRALRRMAKDGPLSCEVSSRGLLTASLSAAMVQPDDAGNVRLVKRGVNNEGRDDVAAALILAAGALDRLPEPRPLRWAVV